MKKFFKGVVGWFLLIALIILGCTILSAFMVLGILILVGRLPMTLWRLFSSALKELDQMGVRVTEKHASGGCNGKEACKKCELYTDCLLLTRIASSQGFMDVGI